MVPRFLPFAAWFAILLAACGKAPAPPAPPAFDPPGETTAVAPAEAPAPTFWSEVKLHEAIRGANPSYSGNGQFQIDERGQVQMIVLAHGGVTDLSPLRGMALQALDLQECPVADLSPLEGMPLVELYLERTAVKDLGPLRGVAEMRKLYLNGTEVKDLSPVKGLALVELNLVGTRVSDLTPLQGMPLQMLWLTDTPATDLRPLARCPLVSLTLHRTGITDLSPLAGTALQRLHIGGTPVTDLTPLRGVPLTRLVFDPDKITKGVEVLREMPTLREVGTKFEDGASDLVPPAAFFASGAAPSTR